MIDVYLYYSILQYVNNSTTLPPPPTPIPEVENFWKSCQKNPQILHIFLWLAKEKAIYKKDFSLWFSMKKILAMLCCVSSL
jgi:hypothetical protein